MRLLFERYGQATALAGDHLATSQDFETTQGLRDTVSFVTYASRAVEDGDHFHPSAPLEWRKNHLAALDQAELLGGGLRGGETDRAEVRTDARGDLLHVLYQNAFGDHFLQDSFVAGHMAVNRAATRPTAMQNYHDRANHKGRVVRDSAGHIWRTLGDGTLHWEESGKTEVLRAAALSVYDTLRAFVTGQRTRVLEATVSDLVPIAYCVGWGCEEIARIARRHGDRGAYRRELHDSPYTRWVGLLLVHTPARMIGAPGLEYRHAFGEDGFLRNQLNVVTSFPLGTTFSFRVDAAFGVITPALRPSEATSLYFRAGLVVPIYDTYGSAFTFDVALGLLDETCVDACDQAVAKYGNSERGIIGGYLGPRINFELGRIALLQLFAEPFFVTAYGGSAFWGLGFGVTLSKGTVVMQPELFPGPPL